MAETREDEPGTPNAARRRPRTAILVGFLLVFLGLLIVFHGVLFPFLMAIFIAYLIEPLVAAFTRSPIFGIRWTRGPTIVLMYVLLLGGIVTAASCAVAGVATSVKKVSSDVAEALNEKAERARFSLDPLPDRPEGAPEEPPVLVPAGTRLVLPPHPGKGDGRGGARTEGPSEPAAPAVFATLYDVVLRAEEPEATVLLRATSEEVPEAGGDGVRILDTDAIRYLDQEGAPDPFRIQVKGQEPAAGLEVFLERRLVTPIVENLSRVGLRVQPTELRDVLNAQARALGEGLPERVTRWGRDVFTTLALSIYEFILILMLTAFIVMDRKSISSFFASLPPPAYRDEYQTLLRYVDRGLAGVIRGQLVICLVNGMLTYVGLLLLGIKGAVILGLVAGIFSLIPIFGTILSTIPIVLVATTDGIDKGLLALGWVMLIHLLEANLLNPLIMGSHARMHPVIIIFALLAGEHAFGVWGALLAVPAMSILQSCFQFYRHEIEGIPPTPQREHSTWMRRLLRKAREKTPEA